MGCSLLKTCQSFQTSILLQITYHALEKIDIPSVSTNSPSFQDKQCLSNNLSSGSNECDNLSMTKNCSCPQILGRQSGAENLPNPQEKQPLVHNVSRNKECDEQSKTENLLHPSKSDIKSVDKKSPKSQDKQSLVNNLSINQDCDELSVPEEMSCPEKLHIQPNAGITPRMKEIDQSITEIDDPDSFMSGNTCWGETTQEKADAYYLKGFVDDIYSSYKNGWLSDFRLHSGNRTFPIHKVILSARSPVFKAMFVSTLKDKDDLDIPDIDVDTLERILLFMYSIKWNIAINLYSAAYRYAIADLKRITRSSLISKISASNVLGILVQANLHKYEDLESRAETFIVENDDDIVGTEHWKKLEKENVHLAVQILSILYVQIKNKCIK